MEFIVYKILQATVLIQPLSVLIVFTCLFCMLNSNVLKGRRTVLCFCLGSVSLGFAVVDALLISAKW